MPSPDRADTVAVAQAFSKHRQAVGVDVKSHQGDSIMGDLMQKAW
jgi:hypothetical protein